MTPKSVTWDTAQKILASAAKHTNVATGTPSTVAKILSNDVPCGDMAYKVVVTGFNMDFKGGGDGKNGPLRLACTQLATKGTKTWKCMATISKPPGATREQCSKGHMVRLKKRKTSEIAKMDLPENDNSLLIWL